MTLPMDIRLASTSAKIGFVFARRGIVPEACSSWFLPRLVGISQALEWCYTGRVFGADEALDGGLVRSIHEPDDLLPAARALAAEIVENTAPVSVALTRRMLWANVDRRSPDGGAPRRFPGNPRARTQRRRARGRRKLSGETACGVHRPCQRRAARHLPGSGYQKVLVKPTAFRADVTNATVRRRNITDSYLLCRATRKGRDYMNSTAMRLRGGDVIELEIDGDIVSALVLLANNENVIFDLCDGNMPCVARQEDLANVRVFDGLAA